MEYHDLQKTKVADLRELAKKHAPDQKGLSALKKDQLVDLVAQKMGIEKPHKHVAMGLGKRAIKAEIRELKKQRAAAREAGEQVDSGRYRKEIHRRKRRLRKMMQLD
jgi:hypothetical protein